MAKARRAETVDSGNDGIEADDLDYVANGQWDGALQRVIDVLAAFSYVRQARGLENILKESHWDPSDRGPTLLRLEEKRHRRLQAMIAKLDDLDMRKLKPAERDELAGVIRIARRMSVQRAKSIADELEGAKRAGEYALMALPPIDADQTAEPHEPPKAVKKKRSTERDEARVKLNSALTTHHQYSNGSCINHEPIGNNALARLAEVDKATASAFFKREFKGHKRYKVMCAKVEGLAAALKLLNKEYHPHHLYGGAPPDETERD
jgi:hypothetical protein